MHPHLEKRIDVRFDHQAPIIIENEKSGSVFRGMIYNYSRGGLYLESDYPLLTGTVMKMRSTFLKESSGVFFLAEVKSCDIIKDPLTLFQYGIRACFCGKSDYKKFARRGLRVLRGGKKDVDIR